LLRRRLRSARRRHRSPECVRNARDSGRQILSLSSYSSRGKRKRHDEPRSGASSRLLRPLLCRMVGGGAPALPPLLPHQPALLRVPRAPRPRAHQGYLVVEAAPAVQAGVLVNKQRARGLQRAALPLHLVHLQSQKRRRTRTTDSKARKTSGNPQDCGVSNESITFHESFLVLHLH